MYILKNSWKNITRTKGRNILIGIIIIIITISSLVSISINKASNNLVKKYKNSNPTEITFDLDMMSLREDRNNNSSTEIEKLDEDSLLEYVNSKYVKDYYYTYQTSLSSDDIEAIDFSDLFKKDEDNDENNKDDNRPNDMKQDNRMNQGDFRFIAYSDVSYIENFINGTNKITSGSMFESDTEENVIVISSALADENELEVGDTMKFYSPSDTDTTYEFKIVGIYESTSTDSNDNFMEMNAMNSENLIYIPISTIKNILSNNSNLSAKIYLNSSDDIEAYEKEVRSKGLSEYYKINNNLDSVLETLKPIQNISNFSKVFLIIILVVGLIIIGILNMINIRDRKYEIGVLRAIGMNKLKVCLEFITELFIVAIISFVIGTSIGSFVSQPITNTMLKNEISSTEEEQNNIDNNFGRPGMERKGFKSNINYVDNLNVKVDIITIVEELGVIIVITLLTSSIAVIWVNKYEPNKILQNRV